LIFQNAVKPANLLLLAKLESIADDFWAARLTMLARRKVTLLNGTLVREAPAPFQKELCPLTPTEPTNCVPISCQSNPLFQSESKFENRRSKVADKQNLSLRYDAAAFNARVKRG
jgi:hypothetical protein